MGRYLSALLEARAEHSHAVAARLEDQGGIADELSRIDPGETITFIHLAARVSVPACQADPAGARLTNVVLAGATVSTVLEWAAKRRATAQVVYVSTGHVYATPTAGSRIGEDDPVGPRSVYARTKLAAERAIAEITHRHRARLVIARVFGLVAPSQGPNYVLPALIDRARRRDLTGIPGLDFARDYLDARDVCADLLLLCAAEAAQDFEVVNVCSGVPVTIRDLLRTVLVVTDPSAADELSARATAAPGRPDDAAWLVGDPTRFTGLTGTAPQSIALLQTVTDAVALAS